MNNYKGLFTFDVDNHRYVPVEQADGIISDMNYHPESEKEPKEDGLDHIITLVEAYNSHDSEMYPKEIVEKLKAWKRLKDKGFRFEGLTLSGWGCPCIEYKVDGGISDSSSDMQVREDLYLLFGGKE